MRGSAETAPDDDAARVGTPGGSDDGSRYVRSRAELRELLLPVAEPTALHATVVAAVLVLDALLVLFVPPSTSGVLSTGLAIYLVLPAAAAVYMSLAAFSVMATHREFRTHSGTVLLPTFSLGCAIGLVGLVTLSGSGNALGPGPVPTVWLYPACLATVALSMAGMWLGVGSGSPLRSTGLVAAALPPALALAFLPPGLFPGMSVPLTTGTLLVGAGLFLLSGFLLGRAAATPRPPAAAPARRPQLSFRPETPSPEAPRVHPGGLRPGWFARSRAVAPSAAPLAPPAKEPTYGAGVWPDVVSTGFGWLDDLFLGGIARRGQLALVGEDGLGRDEVVWGVLSEGLRRGESVVILTASTPVEEIRHAMERRVRGFSELDRAGRVQWVDLSGREGWGRGASNVSTIRPDRARALASLVEGVRNAERRSARGFCVALLGVTPLVDALGDATALTFLRNVVAILRAHPTCSVYSVELDARPRPVLRAMLEELDGALLFRAIDGRPFASAFRLRPVTTRSWVECHFEVRGTAYDAPSRVVAPAAGGSSASELGFSSS